MAKAAQRQFYNPVTRQWVKRDAATGRIISASADGKPFEDVPKEQTKFKIRWHPDITPEMKQWAKKAIKALDAYKAQQQAAH